MGEEQIKKPEPQPQPSPGYHIKDWVLEQGFENYQVVEGKMEDKKILPNLSKINIFVGANNSGKSRFLRQLASTAEIKFVPNINGRDGKPFWCDIVSCQEEFTAFVNALFQKHHIEDAASTRHHLQQIPSLKIFAEKSIAVGSLIQIFNGIASIQQLHPNIISFTAGIHSQQETASILAELKQQADVFKTKLSQLLINIPPEYQFKKLYIPTLRGMRTYDDSPTKDLYFEKTIKDYFLQLNPRPDIFTGLTMYAEIHDLLTGTFNERRTIRKFEHFISNCFFNGEHVTLIPRKNGALHIKIGTENEYPIHQLGDGIQSIIILTFPLFTNEGKQLLVFYEEPEMYMHPSIQRILLNVLSHQFPNHQYFLTTHSNHFLGSSTLVVGINSVVSPVCQPQSRAWRFGTLGTDNLALCVWLRRTNC